MRKLNMQNLFQEVELIQKSFIYNFQLEWLNTDLLTSYGEIWKYPRGLITLAFHFSFLNEFVFIFEKQAQVTVDKIMFVADKKFSDVKALLSLMALESMCKTSWVLAT